MRTWQSPGVKYRTIPAVDNIEREEPEENKQTYESQYTDDDIALLDKQEQDKALVEKETDTQEREKEALAELEKALAEATAERTRQVSRPHIRGQYGNRAAAGHDDGQT